MKAVIQRVKQCSVTVDDTIISRIGPGMLVLLGVAENDAPEDARYLAEKIIRLRIFSDKNGKMNRSLTDTDGEMLVVSQFTLLGDCRKGRRPSFVHAAKPETANALYEAFVAQVHDQGIKVQTGCFGAIMDVSLINDGPVTLVLESK
jgi:D-tyrosyl-tRNA(Tyr) deacylase